ncbi:hypothetical protein K503DRAFT_705198 [Rhizopogon vinicolor AM-OR11-026]|uniref:Uncharacterized protein n=1 Tax=Rhizopogon vinicolor AM-OR11-026 TaxID=1314800 RepID=A0A1B7MD28_9AGAM|nr:hypothetical protein K503DRAFT_705198 [Rhizopogon vinicolor AM-OR11-026]
MITDLGSEDVIIGIDWLRFHNPEIDWNAGKFSLSRCPIKCLKARKRSKTKETKTSVEHPRELNRSRDKTKDTLNLEVPPLIDCEEDDADEFVEETPRSINSVSMEEVEDDDSPKNMWIKYKASVASELAQKDYEAKGMNEKTFKDLVPEWLHQYESVFSE